ncbi:MAG: hypothetical protein OEX07_15115, partial [Gammaproteobacteria bacterium]|nr:hypothetical protein [Gammaproteobacteria bacterium]
LTIGGRSITIHEITFIDGMKVAGLITPMIDDLADALLQTSDGELGLSVLESLFAEHLAIFSSLIVTCSNIDNVNFINELSDEDGQQLLQIFWTVNSRFFMRRLQRRRLEKSKAMLQEKTTQ